MDGCDHLLSMRNTALVLTIPGVGEARDKLWNNKRRLAHNGWARYWDASGEMFMLFSQLLREEEDG